MCSVWISEQAANFTEAYTTFTDWSLQPRRRVFTARYGL